ncbi:MAG: Fe-S cluster assembly protein HesB, partial [Cytophagaceae bacterium]
MQAKALLAHQRLCAEYGAPFLFFSTKDPLSELISALLSHRTK